MEVFPFPNGSHANPTRGLNRNRALFSVSADPPILGVVNRTPSGTAMKLPALWNRSLKPLVNSCRRPRRRFRFGRKRMESFTYQAPSSERKPRGVVIGGTVKFETVPCKNDARLLNVARPFFLLSQPSLIFSRCYQITAVIC